MNKLYVVMSMGTWDSIQGAQIDQSGVARITKIVLNFDNGCCGFLPVFKTKEQAEEAWPGKQVYELSTVTDDNTGTPPEAAQRPDGPGGASPQDPEQGPG